MHRGWARREQQYVNQLRDAGFAAVEVLSHQDYFSASGSEETRRAAGSFGAKSVVLHGMRP